jgi:hypothetical protein
MFGEIYLSVEGRVDNVLSDHVAEDSIPRNFYANTLKNEAANVSETSVN